MPIRMLLAALLVVLAAAADAAPIAGTASLSGAVQAPRAVPGAQVHLLNVDKNGVETRVGRDQITLTPAGFAWTSHKSMEGVLKRAANKTIAIRPSAYRDRHFRMVKRHDVCRDTIVGRRQTGGRSQRAFSRCGRDARPCRQTLSQRQIPKAGQCLPGRRPSARWRHR